LAIGAAIMLILASGSPAAAPQPGITAAPVVAAAYDLILDANFDAVPAALHDTCGPAPAVACLGLEALSLWWQIQLDPASRVLDAPFLAKANAAIAEAERMTVAEPDRAEGWFYLGAGYGVRAQWRVHRRERLAAARDGKRIKAALERALALDPAMHDAEFGLGMYRYYADVAPAVLRFLRWLLLLPGGDREEGLQQLERAATLGQLVRGEAQFQVHLIYLWYEGKWRESLGVIRALQGRYPHNPLFHQIEAEILDAYLHNPEESARASERLLALALAGRVHRPELAEAVARLNLARQLTALDQPAAAIAHLDAIIAARPAAPLGALATAESMRRAMR
jgi:hypothetical protein